MDFSKNRGKSAFRDGSSNSDGFGIVKGGTSRKRSGGKTKKKRGYSKKQQAGRTAEMAQTSGTAQPEMIPVSGQQEEVINAAENVQQQLVNEYNKGLQLIATGQEIIRRVDDVMQNMAQQEEAQNSEMARRGGNPNMGGDPRMGRGRMA